MKETMVGCFVESSRQVSNLIVEWNSLASYIRVAAFDTESNGVVTLKYIYVHCTDIAVVCTTNWMHVTKLGLHYCNIYSRQGKSSINLHNF